MKNKTLTNNLYILKLIHKASPGRIAFGIVLSLLQSISSFLLNVYMLQYVINGIQRGIAFESVVIFLLSLAGYQLFVSVIAAYYTHSFEPISRKKIYEYIQVEMFDKAAAVEIACFENPEFYDKYVKCISEAASRAGQVLSSLQYFLNCTFTILATSFVIFTIDPVLIVFALIPVIVNLIFGKRKNKAWYDYNMEMAEKQRKRDYVSRTFYLTDFAKEMRLTEINRVLFNKFSQAIKELIGIIKKHGKKLFLFQYMFLMVNEVVVFIGATLYAAFKTLVSKTMLVGDCIVIINSIGSIAWSIRQAVDIVLQFHEHALYIDNLREFLNHSPSIDENPDGLSVAEDRFDLKIENLSFKYEGQEQNTLKNINIEIGHNEKIALVGHNGAGKTTLIKLLLHLYEATEGQIVLNDLLISEYKLKEYRDSFGTVFQDYKIFSMSVTENILLKDQPTQEEIDRATAGMKLSGVYDKVSELENGADTTLTREFDDNGAILSGGEAQKVAIARAFAKDSKMIILDEPSSALDPIAEYKMYEAMMQVCQNKPVIFISHRLSSAVLADRVYLMENGEIVEAGTHYELLKKNGKYADMWHKQAEKYKSEDF